MKNVVITGAGGALGKACVNEFVTNGDQVIAILSTSKKNSNYEVEGVATYHTDLGDELKTKATIAKVIEGHKAIDVGILTVGGFSMGDIDGTDGTQLRKMISLNFETTYYLSRELFRHMSTNGKGGRIVLIGARPALDAKAGKDMIAYALSKTLVMKLAELLNADGKDKNIVCSVIVPSIIDTQTNRDSMPNADYTKWVTPAEIAKNIRFITSESGSALRQPILKIYGES